MINTSVSCVRIDPYFYFSSESQANPPSSGSRLRGISTLCRTDGVAKPSAVALLARTMRDTSYHASKLCTDRMGERGWMGERGELVL